MRANKLDYVYLKREIQGISRQLINRDAPDDSQNKEFKISLNSRLSEIFSGIRFIKFKYYDPNPQKWHISEYYQEKALDYNNPDQKLYLCANPVVKFLFAYEDENHPENKRYNLEEAGFIGNLMNSYNNFRHQSKECKNERDKMLDEYKEKNPDKVSGYDDVEVMKLMCMDHLAKLREYKAI